MGVTCRNSRGQCEKGKGLGARQRRERAGAADLAGDDEEDDAEGQEQNTENHEPADREV